MLKKNEPYTCEQCGKIFISTRDESEAQEEANHLWDQSTWKEGSCVICHSCWVEFMKGIGRSDDLGRNDIGI